MGAVWVWENVAAGKFTTDFTPYFQMLYSFVVVLMCVPVINYFIIRESENIFRQPVFLIALGLITYFLYQMVYDWSFKMAELRGTDASQDVIISSFGYVNAAVNLLYAVAILLVRSEKKLI